MSFSMLPQRRPSRVVRSLPPGVPEPSYRHASPSGPWPWLDLEKDFKAELDSPPQERPLMCEHLDGKCTCWTQYPQSLFPNWTKERVDDSKILRAQNLLPCVIYRVDVSKEGGFSDLGKYLVNTNEEFWKKLQEEPQQNIRLKALFVENMSVPVLQMLGTKYNIEPFFFSSSVNEIPSRYQEDPKDRDHVTITLSFPRAIPYARPLGSDTSSSRDSPMIDPQRPLHIYYSDDITRTENYVLFLDFMAVHMVRTPTSSTIISYHPSPTGPATSAEVLHDLVALAGRSVYWQHIYRTSNDPTLTFLTILWYAVYSWDHALAKLGRHIRQLESSVIRTNSIRFIQDLHKIRAYLLRYDSLLDDLHNSVEYLSNTNNPAMASPSPDKSMEKECKTLLNEVKRLRKDRKMHDERLNNVIQLVFNSVNIEDSKHMKHISYLTMVFLPASFVANLFGMNIREIVPQTNGTLVHYVLIAGLLTAVTIWFIVAVQGRWYQDYGHSDMSIWARLAWPIIMIMGWRRQLSNPRTRV